MHALLLTLAFAAPAPRDWPTREEAAVARELAPFPSADTARAAIRFLETRCAWLAAQRLYYSDPVYAPWFDAAQDDNMDRLLTWQALDAARDCLPEGADRTLHNPGAMPDQNLDARGWLGELRGRVGAEAYRNGQMPPVCDLRFFRRAD